MKPWIVDITESIIADNKNTINYAVHFLHYNGTWLLPQKSGGDVIISSNIIYYKNISLLSSEFSTNKQIKSISCLTTTKNDTNNLFSVIIIALVIIILILLIILFWGYRKYYKSSSRTMTEGRRSHNDQLLNYDFTKLESSLH